MDYLPKRAREQQSIKSLANEYSLHEAVFYGIAGNEIYRKSISGNEYMIQTPTTSGLYVPNMSLTNNASKTFKILVK